MQCKQQIQEYYAIYDPKVPLIAEQKPSGKCSKPWNKSKQARKPEVKFSEGRLHTLLA